MTPSTSRSPRDAVKNAVWGDEGFSGSGLRVYRVPFLDLADIPSFRGM